MKSEANELKKLALQNNLHWGETWVGMKERWVEVYKSWREKNYPDNQLLIYIKNGRVIDCDETAKKYPDNLYKCVLDAIERMATEARG